jgi:hypothetical protein
MIEGDCDTRSIDESLAKELRDAYSDYALKLMAVLEKAEEHPFANCP